METHSRAKVKHFLTMRGARGDARVGHVRRATRAPHSTTA